MIWFVSALAVLFYLVGMGKDKQIQRLEGYRRGLADRVDYLQEELEKALRKIEDLELDLECEKMRNKN